jgi:uncharacterized protein (TIGR02597 family)
MKTPYFSCSFAPNLISSPHLVKGFFMGRFLFTVVVGLASIQLAAGQTPVTTDPVGFVQPFNASPNQINLLANSDTLVSTPFTRPPAFTGAISSIAGNVITVVGSPGWTTSPQQFVYAQGTQSNHYYVLIGPSSSADPKEGHTYNVTANGSNTLTVDTSSDDLGGIPANTQIVVIPHQTLGTVFPATDSNVSYTPTTATRSFKTEILIPNFSPTGINPSASAIYFYSNNVNGTTNNVGWRVVGDNTTPHDDDVLIPYGYFTVRNQNGAPGLTLTTIGSVLTKKFATPELTSATQGIDNSFAMIRPIGVPLSSTGLNPADNSFVATTATRSFKDELLVFDNTAASINKSASAIYFYSNNVNGTTNNVGWRLVGDNTTPHDGDVIAPGSAFIIRKAANGTGGTVFWTNAPTY